MFKDSKIYVAGHAGLLGSAVLRILGSEGYSKIVTRTHRELDLTDQKRVDKFFATEYPEYIFLCAGLSGGILWNKTNPATFLHTNIAMQDNVFEAAQRYNVRNLIFYGSSCIYPKNSTRPIKEEDLLTGEIEETSEAYAIAKIAGIKACKSYNSEYRTNRFIALIPNSIYGPDDHFDVNRSHVLAALIQKFRDAKREEKDEVVLWGSGDPRREFIFSEDIADASLFAMLNADRLENSHYNIGTGIDYSVRELAGIIAETVDYDGEISWDTTRPDGAPRKLLDSSRFISLGWRPETSLKEGLAKTYNWYISNKE